MRDGINEEICNCRSGSADRNRACINYWLEKQQGDENGFVIVGDGILLRYTGNERVVKIPEGTRVIGNFFTGNEGVEEIHIPESVEEIKMSAFTDVVQPLKVYIPDTVW